MNIKYLYIAVLILLCSCENDINAVRELGQRKIGVEEGTNIDSYLSQSGVVKARLTAPLMLRYQIDTPRIEFPKTMRVYFYDSTQKVEHTLFAKSGNYNENDRLVLLRDSIIMIKHGGDTLKTTELWWDQNKETLYTNKLVTIFQMDGTRLFALDGMQSKQDLSRLTLFNTRGELPIPDSTMP